MNYKATALLLPISSLLPQPAFAADAQYIIDKVMKLEEERREGVNRYIVEQEAVGYVSKFAFQNIERDYRTVPGSNMYEPYQQVMRLTGETADEAKKEMEEARAQLEEFDQQMAEMPESQRKTAAGDGIESVTNVRSITVE